MNLHRASPPALLAIADGAGGTGRGAEAAAFLVDLVHDRSHHDTLDVVQLLRTCDVELAQRGAGAETTAVIALVSEDGIMGASVGDSGAWLIDEGTRVDLTCRQVRKPLIGSGAALPVPFGCGPLIGTLLLASDGLLKYGNAARIAKIASASELDALPDQLIDSVRLRSGQLPDDVAIALCRRIAPLSQST